MFSWLLFLVNRSLIFIMFQELNYGFVVSFFRKNPWNRKYMCIQNTITSIWQLLSYNHMYILIKKYSTCKQQLVIVVYNGIVANPSISLKFINTKIHTFTCASKILYKFVCIHSIIHSFNHSLTHSLLHSFTCTYWFVCLLINFYLFITYYL